MSRHVLRVAALAAVLGACSPSARPAPSVDDSPDIYRRDDPLLELARLEGADRRRVIVNLSGDHEAGATTVPILVELLDDPDAGVRRAAADLLCELGDTATREFVAELLVIQESQSRYAALYAQMQRLEDIRPRVDYVRQLDLAHGTEGERAALIVAACFLGVSAEEALPFVERRCGAEDPMVARTARTALAVLGRAAVVHRALAGAPIDVPRIDGDAFDRSLRSIVESSPTAVFYAALTLVGSSAGHGNDEIYSTAFERSWKRRDDELWDLGYFGPFREFARSGVAQSELSDAELIERVGPSWASYADRCELRRRGTSILPALRARLELDPFEVWPAAYIAEMLPGDDQAVDALLDRLEYEYLHPHTPSEYARRAIGRMIARSGGTPETLAPRLTGLLDASKARFGNDAALIALSACRDAPATDSRISDMLLEIETTRGVTPAEWAMLSAVLNALPTRPERQREVTDALVARLAHLQSVIDDGVDTDRAFVIVTRAQRELVFQTLGRVGLPTSGALDAVERYAHSSELAVCFRALEAWYRLRTRR